MLWDYKCLKKAVQKGRMTNKQSGKRRLRQLIPDTMEILQLLRIMFRLVTARRNRT
jgi:hypothetical protein